MAKPKTMETRKLVSMPAQLANAIEDYRYTNRIPSDSEAIRRLIEAGLRATAAQAEPAPARQRKR
jgi:Arc/MetJ-type ribon-helix-helix transcriptional regulator